MYIYLVLEKAVYLCTWDCLACLSMCTDLLRMGKLTYLPYIL